MSSPLVTPEASSPEPGAEALPDPSALSYEQAKTELRVIVSQLEVGSAPLEETLELWQRGEALAARCRAVLEAASAQIDAVAVVDAETVAVES